MNEQEWMEKLKQEGFHDIAICPIDWTNRDFGEHTHKRHTVHVILKGELTLIDEYGEKSIKKGERFEIPAGTTHNSKCGPDGCIFIVGVK